MRSRAFKLFAISAIAIGAPIASQASVLETFTVSNANITGLFTLTLTTTANPAIDDITGISGTFSTTTGSGFSGIITGLTPASYSSSSPSSNNLSIFDNLFYPTSAAPALGGSPAGGLLDFYGLDFTVAGGYTVNLWGAGTGNGYRLSDGISSYVDDTATVKFASTPEPSAIGLLALALFGILFLASKRAFQTN